MRLQQHTVRGLTVFKKDVTIPFKDLPAGLIAVVGANGQGKTSLVESIFAALYRELPTREGSLYQWFSGREGLLSTSFYMGEQFYNARVLVDAQAEKSEAYFTGDGLTPTNGKLTTFDQSIQKLLGPKELLLSSVFGAQNGRGNFVDMSVADRKELFTNLLGLGRFPLLEAKTKERVSDTLARISGWRTELEVLNGYARAGAETQSQIDAIDERLVMLDETIPLLTSKKARLDAKIVELSEQIGNEASIADELLRVQDERKRLEAELTSIAAKIKDRGNTIFAEKSAWKKNKQAIEQKLEGLRSRTLELSTVLLSRESIEEAVRRRTEIQSIMEPLAIELEASKAEFIARRELSFRVSTAQSVAATEQSRLTEAMESVKDLDSIPCKGESPYDGCIKIRRSIQAKNSIPALEVSYAAAARVVVQTQSELDKPDTGRATGVIDAEIVTLRREFKSLEAQAARQHEVREAATLIEQTDIRINELDGQLQGFPAEPTEVGDPIIKSLMDRAAEVISELESVDARYKAAEHTANARKVLLIARDSEQTLLRGTADLIQKHTQESSDLNAKRSTLETQLKGLDDIRLKSALIDTRITSASNDAAEWTMLTKAFGPSGIPALEIDAAGPGISNIVNELLSSCFSTRFAMDIQTQKSSADGKKNLETFDIRILDSKNGRSGSIAGLSGGEKAVVGEALSLGIALYRKGTALETIIRDEVTGSLDPENAVRYVHMMRKAIALGKCHQAIVVTHNPECAELADARLRCVDGRVEVEM